MTSSAPLFVVWLKRDLRLHDHAPLVAATQAASAAEGRVVLLYCFEPSMVTAEDASPRHWRFVWQSLSDIEAQLQLSGAVWIAQEEMLDVLEQLRQIGRFHSLYAHEEVGNALTFARDRKVAAWCRKHGVAFHESPFSAVRRPLWHRQDWTTHWNAVMSAPVVATPLDLLRTLLLPSPWPTDAVPVEWTTSNTVFQPGGERYAWRYLRSFFQERVKGYARAISKPEASRRGCSRVSVYLAWGNLSVRQVYQQLVAARQAGQSRFDLRAFESRIRWRDHFIQKFESECRIETENHNRAYDSLRTEWNEELYLAWEEGRTGYPLVDACMRCVVQTGYLNFRMRAMLVSFLTHSLWLDWRRGSRHLARAFLDYEPGIHYPQFQMQAGTVGTHIIRTYNPVKQAQEHDPEAVFIKQWVPELASLPTSLAHQPWRMTAMEQQLYGVQLGIHYPAPIVRHEEAARRAQKLLWNHRKSQEALLESRRILRQHSTPNRKPQ